MASKQQQMHSLEQFLAQAQGPSMSWADVDDDLEMDVAVEEPPSEPADRHEPVPPSRATRHRAAPVLSRSPPFVIYCGNLNFNCTEQNLTEFFAPLQIREIRMVIDPQTKRAKGFGYVEFHTRDDMERAFERNAEPLLNRPIRIDVQTGRNHEDRPQRHHHHHQQQQQQHHPAPAQPAAPAERRKLNLQPRTVDANKSSDAAPAPKANPFGAARPREEVLKEKAKTSAAATPSAADQAADKRSSSPWQSRPNHPAVSDSRPSQKPAWGPVQSVLSQQQQQQQQTTTSPAAAKSGSTPTAAATASSQRHAWGPRGTTPRSNPAHSNLADSSHRAPDRHTESRPNNHRHGPMPNAGHDRRGDPVRQQQQQDHPERRTGPRPHEPESKCGPRSNNGPDHRPRHRHDDRKGSREKASIPTPKQAEVAEPSSSGHQPRPAGAGRPRSQSPSRTADDAGFEVQRKGRRNGSGRNASSSLASTMSKIDLNNSGPSNGGRKEKSSSGAAAGGNSRSWASAVQSPHAEIPSSVSYSSNMFSYLASEDD